LDINRLSVGLTFNWGDRLHSKGKAENLRQEDEEINTLPEGRVVYPF